MILKRQEKDNKIKAIYESSNILASTYDKTDTSLTLIFKKGGQYKYSNVSASDYTRFEIAESQGVVFNTHIKKYSFDKLADVDPSEIVNEISALSEAENKAIAEGRQLKLTNLMKEMLTESVDAQGNVVMLSVDRLVSLQTLLNETINQLTPKTA